MTTPENAVYANWARHFGKASRDPELVAEFQAAGIAKVPTIRGGELETRADVGALTVILTDPEFMGLEAAPKRGEGILAGIAIHLGDWGEQAYTGPLPYSVAADDSRKSLRKKLGKPNDSDEEDCWDDWIIEGRVFTALYSEDFARLMTLTVYLPDED